MELQEVQVVGLEAAKGFFELLRRGLFRAPVNLGH